jgi:predicted metal-dependent hydrolase
MTESEFGPADRDDVAVALDAGAALFNEGHVLAAHEPWEAAWLPLDDGDDERLLHGLIAAAAATHHATSGNRSGATGCASNAVEYLGGVDGGYRGLSIDPVHEWCRRIAADPTTVERASPPTLRIRGVAVRFEDLDLAATLAAAPALAEGIAAGDEETLSTAAALAREEHGTGRTTVTELVFDFVREPDARPQVAARIADRVERAERKRRDVDGLFEQ